MRLIDADALRDALIECTPYAMDSTQSNTNSQIDMFTVMEILDNAPTVDAVAMVHGEWATKEYGYYPHCSICDFKTNSMKGSNYCPNCGAKMGRGDGGGVGDAL